MALPDCDTLFLRYLNPWYSEQDRARRGYQASRPDVEQLSAPSESSASDLSPLSPESQFDTAQQIREMFEAASEDWKGLLGVKGAPSIDWIREFHRYFQRRQIQRILKRSDTQQYDNDYLVLCSELGAVLGTLLEALEPRLAWLYDWPYWESALYDQRTRSRVNVFHWALKRLSESGVDEDLKSKLEECRRMLGK